MTLKAVFALMETIGSTMKTIGGRTPTIGRRTKTAYIIMPFNGRLAKANIVIAFCDAVCIIAASQAASAA